jgi:hypothetical protein
VLNIKEYLFIWPKKQVWDEKILPTCCKSSLNGIDQFKNDLHIGEPVLSAETRLELDRPDHRDREHLCGRSIAYV